MPAITIEQVKARYDAGTMGYDSCIIYLMREYHLTEAQADNVLHPIQR